MSIESVIPSNHLILCHPLLLLPSVFPSIRVFSNEWAVRIRWPKYWSFCFSISPSNEYQGCFPLGSTGLISCSTRDSQETLIINSVWYDWTICLFICPPSQSSSDQSPNKPSICPSIHPSINPSDQPSFIHPSGQPLSNPPLTNCWSVYLVPTLYQASGRCRWSQNE